jgi:gas vesicle protein
MADVFISYCREDKDRIIPILEGLTSLGLTVWSDARIETGGHWDEVIEKELSEASAVMVCWSQNSVRSAWVKAEAKFAQEHEKVVPFSIEACKIPLQFQFDQAEDLSGWGGERAHEGWRKIIETIGKLVRRPGLRQLLGARESGDDRKLLAWAQMFGEDPCAAETLTLVAQNERNRFDTEFAAVRDVTSKALSRWEKTLQSTLNDCAKEFELWVTNLNVATYEARPNLNSALEALGTSLAAGEIRKLEAERDAALERATSSDAQLNAALAENRTLRLQPRSHLRRWGRILASCLVGTVVGFAAHRIYGDDPANTELQLRLSQTEESAQLTKSTLENKLHDAELQLNEYSSAPANIAALKGQLSDANEALKLEQNKVAQYESNERTLKEHTADLEKQIRELRPPKPAQPSSAAATQGPMASGTASFVIPAGKWTTAKNGRCKIEVGGRTYFDGSCSFSSTPDKGFQIQSRAVSGKTYRAYWYIESSGGSGKKAQGRWNGPEASGDEMLGTMEPDRADAACWVNSEFKICVWK